MTVSMIGLDIAKQVFQVHGVDEAGGEVVRKRLRRSALLGFFASLPPVLVGMEACATAHHWARELRALGHEVRLVPPRYVKVYVRRNKTDAADAAAICEALRRPGLHAVPVKSTAQQAVLMLHRTRELLVEQRTMTANALRAHLAEFGIVAAQGQGGLTQLKTMVGEPGTLDVPPEAGAALALLAAQCRELELKIRELERRIVLWHKNDATSRRLATIPGIGPIIASALSARVADATVFRTGRHFAAWLGLTPREWSSGMKRRQGRISKRGDAYLRRLLVLGAHAVMRHSGRAGPHTELWLQKLRARRPPAVAAIALANKMARIAWAVMVRAEIYHRRAAMA